MKKVIPVILFFMAMFMGDISAQAAVITNQESPDFTLMDSMGQEHSLSQYRGKYVVLEWVNYECPFVKKHYQSGNMQSLQGTNTANGVVWLSINSSAKDKQGYYEPDQINQIIENSDSKPTAYLIDTNGSIGKLYGAKTTPHMYIVNPEGVLIYQGAIDSVPSVDSADIPGATNYVQQALNQAMAGESVSEATTKSYGCSVKY